MCIRDRLYVDIQEPGTSDVIRIGTTHLDHSTDLIRSAMAVQINERIGTGDTPTLLGGDFNARTDSNVICEEMCIRDSINTNRSYHGHLQCDYKQNG